jgi:predicted aldo/keto reductase-like oxidoreductase
MKNKEITRRDFLKAAGAGGLVVATGLAGCKPRNAVSGEGGAPGDIPTDKMTYRTNPHTGDRVSLLGYGCMRWPMRENGAGGEEIDQDTVNALVDYAIAHGVNYFDTAPVYIRGWSEAATGIALARHPRDKWFIATKASRDVTLAQGKEMYAKSMRDLQVDHIDYYLLHSIGSVESFHKRFIDNGFLDFMLEERKAGRIRNLGWSFHGNKEAFDYVLAYKDIQWDFCQIQLNYRDWKHSNPSAEYMYNELVKKNVPAVIMEPLLGGRLARIQTNALSMMKEMHPERPAADWAFRYAGTPENVLTVLSGMTYMEHLQENIRSYAPLEPINEAENAILEQVTELITSSDYIQCTACQYCMPCSYGLDIPGIFQHYDKCVSEGKLLKSSGDENYRKARREFLLGYDRSVPVLRQAARCTECEVCRPKCPQGINIPAQMRRVDAYAELLRQEKEF